MDILLTGTTIVALVGVPHLTFFTFLALYVALGVVERLQIIGLDIAGECVAKHEIAVGFLAAAHKQSGEVSRSAIVGRILNGQRSRACLHPHKTPVVVKTIVELLARLKGVLGAQN